MASSGGTEFRARLVALREVSDREPLGTDISDYSDEFCAGFLAGQANALDVLADSLPEDADELKQLRAAWNAHMATCPQHAAVPIPTMEEIQAWRDAPSGTASA